MPTSLGSRLSSSCDSLPEGPAALSGPVWALLAGWPALLGLRVHGSTIRISIVVKDDGELSLIDVSHGSAADEFFGEGSEVEAAVTLAPEAVRALADALGLEDQGNPSESLGARLAEDFRGDTDARSRFVKLCDRFGVAHKHWMWTD